MYTLNAYAEHIQHICQCIHSMYMLKLITIKYICWCIRSMYVSAYTLKVYVGKAISVRAEFSSF